MEGSVSDVYSARLGEQHVIVKMGCRPREVSAKHSTVR